MRYGGEVSDPPATEATFKLGGGGSERMQDSRDYTGVHVERIWGLAIQWVGQDRSPAALAKAFADAAWAYHVAVERLGRAPRVSNCPRLEDSNPTIPSVLYAREQHEDAEYAAVSYALASQELQILTD